MPFEATHSHDIARRTGEPVTEQQARKTLRDAFFVVTNELPVRSLGALQVEETIPADGLPLNGRRIVDVFVKGHRAIRVHPSQRDHWKSKRGERGRYLYYELNDTLYVMPETHETVRAYLIERPEWTGNTGTVSFPRSLYEIYVTYAAYRLIEERMRVLQGRFPDPPQGYPTRPTPPEKPDIGTYLSQSSDIERTTIQDLPDSPELDFTLGPTPSGAFTIGTVDPPTPPAASTIYIDLPGIPVYQGPSSLSLDLTDLDTRQEADDVEMAASELQELQLEIESFNAKAQEALQTFRSKIEAYQSTVQALSEEAQVDLSAFQSEVQAYSSTVQAQVQTFRAETEAAIQKYRAEGDVHSAYQGLALQAEQARIQAALTGYEAEVGRRVQQAEIAAREAAQAAQQATEVSVQEANRKLERDLQTYRLELEQHQQALSNYQSEVQVTIEKQNAEISRRQQRARMMQYDVQRLRREYQERKNAWISANMKHPDITPMGPLPL